MAVIVSDLDAELKLRTGEFLAFKRFPDGRAAAVVQFAFTFAIIADVTDVGYSRRWCYSDRMQTLCALDDWDDYESRPEGWHREVHTGQRRDEDGNDIGVW